MPAEYDPIAELYQKSRLLPYRLHVELFTMLELIGDLTGTSALDLACGAGTYARLLKGRGATRVVGIDVSPRMIELARAEETRRPLGIEYQVQDANQLRVAEQFDIVVAAFLLNHARSAEELQAMCRGIAAALKPGGRFVAVNNDCDQPPETFPLLRKYGIGKSADGDLRDGTPITITFCEGDHSFSLVDYYLSWQTHEEAFRLAGLKDLRCHPPRLSPEGAAEFGLDYWRDFLAHPPMFLDCVR